MARQASVGLNCISHRAVFGSKLFTICSRSNYTHNTHAPAHSSLERNALDGPLARHARPEAGSLPSTMPEPCHTRYCHRPRPHATLAAVLQEASGIRTVDDALARKLRGFGPLGVLAFVVIAALGAVLEPLGTVLVLGWISASQTSWREIGFVRPKSWVRTTILGIVFGCALKFVLKAIVMPLLGADPINRTYLYLVGNSAAVVVMAFYVLVASFNEETVFRGFVFERLGKLLGPNPPAKIATVLLSSAWFATVHYVEQGGTGVEQAAITGLAFGTMFAVTREIWISIVAHAAYDLTAIAIIYWNIESTIAHLVFN